MKRERTVKIYAWICPTIGSPVYVGKTSMAISRRMANHRRGTRRENGTPKEMWLADLVGSRLEPKIVVLQETTVARSSAVERRWIRRLSRRFELLNRSAGGAGNPGVGRIDWTDDLLRALGTVPDSEIAKLLGCHRKAVGYKRECLGIPASFSRKNNMPPPSMGGWNRKDIPDEIAERLGLSPDYVLANIASVSRKVIARHRRERGIKSYAQATGNDGRIRSGECRRRYKV